MRNDTPGQCSLLMDAHVFAMIVCLSIFYIFYVSIFSQKGKFYFTNKKYFKSDGILIARLLELPL